MKLDLNTLRQYEEKGLLSIKKHPTADLYSIGYTQKVQFERLWDEITLQCRGLIIDGEGNVKSRTFKKFFNLDEHKEEEIPNEPFEAFDKLDGSLGICYFIDGNPYIATRGSFESDQAKHATKVLYEKYYHLFDQLNHSCTYLFEIIYEQNRIVVDYGDLDDIVLLTLIDNETGEESLPEIGFPIVKRYDGINDLSQLKALEENNKEGFVVRFKSGMRVKMKFAEYVRLHRIITGVSNVTVWEYLSQGKSFDELLDKVPDEFYNWLQITKKDLEDKFNQVLTENKLIFKELETRKETALYFQTQKHPSVLFSMLDGKAPDKVIWKMIRPKYSKPFNTQIEC